MTQPRVLFLQGLPSPFFNRVAEQLVARGCYVTAICFCLSDRLFWRGPNAVNYRGKFEHWEDFLEAFLTEHRITDILLVGEKRTYHEIAIQCAKRLAVRVTVTDNGYLRPDWLILERDGTNASSHLPRDPQCIHRLAANLPDADLTVRYRDSFWHMAVLDMAYHFILFFFGFLYPHYRRSYRRDNPFLHYPAIGLRLLKRPRRERQARLSYEQLRQSGHDYFLFPLQMEHDFSIVAYSPFDSLEEAAERVIASFARHAPAQSRLLVKLHPLDTGIKNWGRVIARLSQRHGIGERVVFVDGGDLDQMIHHARGVVTVNSTVGIRALQLGCPVKALGQAIYNVQGLAFLGKLDGFWAAASAPSVDLLEDWIKLIATTVQVQGGYYSDPGLGQAAIATADYLCAGAPMIEEYVAMLTASAAKKAVS